MLLLPKHKDFQATEDFFGKSLLYENFIFCQANYVNTIDSMFLEHSDAVSIHLVIDSNFLHVQKFFKFW